MIVQKMIYTLVLVGLVSGLVGAATDTEGLAVVGVACMSVVLVILVIGSLFAIWAA